MMEAEGLPAQIHGAKILIVDDDEFFRTLIERLLSSAGYLNIFSTGDPERVVQLHCDKHFDLILLDIHMPKLSGLDVLEQLNALDPALHVPVIVLTGDEDVATRVENAKLSSLVEGTKAFTATAKQVFGEDNGDTATQKAFALLRDINQELRGKKVDLSDPSRQKAALDNVAIAMAAGASGRNVLEEAAKSRDGERKAERENATLRDQLSAMLSKSSEGGKGTEKPSCWYVRGTTRPEYIFDVALTSSGLLVQDIPNPGRSEEKAELPIADIQFGHAISEGVFLATMEPLLQWSDKHQCRFFVRTYDETALAEKELFKQRLRTLEQRFYKFLSPDLRPNINAAVSVQ